VLLLPSLNKYAQWFFSGQKWGNMSEKGAQQPVISFYIFVMEMEEFLR